MKIRNLPAVTPTWRGVALSAALLLTASCLPSTSTAAENADIKAQIAILQKQLDALQAQMAKLQAQVVEKTPAPAATPTVASESAREPDTSVGGYGEIAFNGYAKDPSRNQADLRRFVLFLGHRFNDRLSFNGEVEWEHAVASAEDEGEAEIEQAWLNYGLQPGFNVKAGLFLMPFGFLNQSHEPPVFYGVERNFVETRIIPTTWREGGIGLTGGTDSGFAWDVGLTTGFDVAKFDDSSAPLAAVHQELQFAKAHDLAGYAALNYRGVPGLTVGGALFYGNSAQGNADFKADDTQPDFSGLSAPVTLWDLHIRWQSNDWDWQALYARGTIGQAGRLDQTLAAFNAANSADRPFVPAAFDGWLVQGAYTVWQRGDMTLAPFVRYEQFNTQARMPAGFTADPANADRVITLGLSLEPLPQVVFKADYQKFQNNSANDRYNFGLGYMF